MKFTTQLEASRKVSSYIAILEKAEPNHSDDEAVAAENYKRAVIDVYMHLFIEYRREHLGKWARLKQLFRLAMEDEVLEVNHYNEFLFSNCFNRIRHNFGLYKAMRIAKKLTDSGDERYKNFSDTCSSDDTDWIKGLPDLIRKELASLKDLLLCIHPVDEDVLHTDIKSSPEERNMWIEIADIERQLDRLELDDSDLTPQVIPFLVEENLSALLYLSRCLINFEVGYFFSTNEFDLDDFHENKEKQKFLLELYTTISEAWLKTGASTPSSKQDKYQFMN